MNTAVTKANQAVPVKAHYADQDNMQELLDMLNKTGQAMLHNQTVWSEEKGKWQHFVLTMEQPKVDTMQGELKRSNLVKPSNKLVGVN